MLNEIDAKLLAEMIYGSYKSSNCRYMPLTNSFGIKQHVFWLSMFPLFLLL